MEFVKLTQQLEGYGDEYYPAKVLQYTIHFFHCIGIWYRLNYENQGYQSMTFHVKPPLG